MTLGDPILRDGIQSGVLASTLSLDHRNAASIAIAAYLSKAIFVIAGEAPEGSEELSIAPDKGFQLKNVTHVWPSGKETIKYPSASIIEAAKPKYTEDFVPHALDETWNAFKQDTVLWHIKEASLQFQIDFWANSDPVREAIAAHLEHLFNPEEVRRGVMLEGPKEYFCCPVRVTLEDTMRIDNSESALTNERRLKTLFVADIPVLQLRAATYLDPMVEIVDGDGTSSATSADDGDRVFSDEFSDEFG